MTLIEQIDSAPTSVVGPNVSADTDTGVVAGDPKSLAATAGLTLDQYSLARMCASEEGRGPAPYLLAVAECAVNEAAHRKVSVSDLLIGKLGKFSQQGVGKWASTARPATGRSVAAAKAALSGSQFVGGARDFFSPSGQRVGDQQGVAKITLSAQKYIDRNKQNGLIWVGDLQGIDPGRLMVFADKDKIKTPEENEERSISLSYLPLITSFACFLALTIVALGAAGKIG